MRLAESLYELSRRARVRQSVHAEAVMRESYQKTRDVLDAVEAECWMLVRVDRVKPGGLWALGFPTSTVHWHLSKRFFR